MLAAVRRANVGALVELRRFREGDRIRRDPLPVEPELDAYVYDDDLDEGSAA